jgi:pyridoxal phosphate enzyme (YggS family)
MNARIAAMRAAIAEAAGEAGRDPATVTLLGVTKGQPRAAVLEAIASGLGDVGESYVQEARPKLFGLPPVRKHFIGHVQTNKARAIVETFDVIQSIDRLDAARAIAKAARALGKPVRVLLQVNVSPNERFGFIPEDAPAIAARLRKEEGLEIDGVMAIGPLAEDRSLVAEAFRRAALAFRGVGGSTLSVGMSADWREAIGCGSTMVRLGTALFGPRPAKERRRPDDESAGR